MQNPEDVTNPGLVNVADQGDGPLVVDQPVATGPSTNPGTLVQATAEAHGLGTASPDQPVTVTPPQEAQLTVQGGTFSPESPNVQNVTQNNVAGQVYGQGTPQNVFV